MLPNEPLALAAATQLAKAVVLNGTVSFSGHCQQQMVARNMTAVDCTNVTRGGWCQSYDFIDATYRYQIATHRMAVVIAFEDTDELTFVTCWRIK